MKYFISPDNELFAYESDGSQDHIIPETLVPATDAQVQAIQNPPIDPKVAALAQIDALESQTMMIRGTRESLLAFAVAIAGASGVPESTLYAQNIAYKKMKDLDTQISALRHSL